MRRVFSCKVLSAPAVSKRSVVTGGGRAASAGQFRNPLANRDPSTRNIAIPDEETLPSAATPSQRAALTQTADEQRRRITKSMALQTQQRLLWDGTVLTDKAHKLVEHFKLLKTSPKYRDAKRMMLVSGRTLIEEAVEQGFHPKRLLIAEGATPPRKLDKDTQVVRASHAILKELDGGTDGYVGDFRIPDPPLKEELIGNTQRLKQVLVLDNVTDPGKLGTMLRTAAAFSYDAVIATNHCADLYSHDVIRAARGAHFQSTTPFYTLREEDGDDAMGMLNHIVERNDLKPIVYTPEGPPARGSTPDSSVTTAARSAAKTLHELCVDRYVSEGQRTSDGKKTAGHLVIGGDDHTKSLHRRLEQRLTRQPTTVLLDEPEGGDIVTDLPVVLYQLRETAAWDYLTASESSAASVAASSTELGVGGPEMVAPSRESRFLQPNRDEEEQKLAAYEDMLARKERRLRKYRQSDISAYADAEKERIAAMAKEESRLAKDPLAALIDIEEGIASRPPKGMHESHLHPMRDYSENMDRDTLRQEAENAAERSNIRQYDRRLTQQRPKGSKIRL